MSEHHGSCHCGKIRLTLRDDPVEAGDFAARRARSAPASDAEAREDMRVVGEWVGRTTVCASARERPR